MASTVVCQKPSVDYFSLSAQKPQNIPLSSSSFVWDSSPYDLTVPSPESCDSIIPSPTSPTLSYPTYNLPKTEDGKDQVFNFGSFDDWMGWDDPADNALSPTTDFFPELKMEPVSPNISKLDLHSSNRGVNPASIQNSREEAAVFGDEPTSEEPLFQTPSINGSVSWPQPNASARRQYSRLTPEEEAQLRSIAMPQISKSQSQSQNYPGSPSSASSPEHNDNRRKRKSSIDYEEEDEEEERISSGSSRHHPKKTAHNMIEKRYRTNLNDKITALRDSVPSLRIISRKNSRGEEVQEDLQGLTPAHKLNKATVLSKATEYIAHLEKRNKLLQKENAALKSRVEAFEILMLARQTPGSKPGNVNVNMHTSNSRQNSHHTQRFGIDSLMR